MQFVRNISRKSQKPSHILSKENINKGKLFSRPTLFFLLKSITIFFYFPYPFIFLSNQDTKIFIKSRKETPLLRMTKLSNQRKCSSPFFLIFHIFFTFLFFNRVNKLRNPLYIKCHFSLFYSIKLGKDHVPFKFRF